MKREHEEWFALNREWIEKLGQYNSEQARGLVHTPEYQAVMRIAQERYDARLREMAGSA